MLGYPVYEDLIIYEVDNPWNDESKIYLSFNSHKFYITSKECQFYEKDHTAVRLTLGK